MQVWDNQKSAKDNFDALKRLEGITAKDIAAAADTSTNAVNVYVANGFLSRSGNETEDAKKIKAALAQYFMGGIPKNLGLKKESVDLFDLYGCRGCNYRMRSEPGCAKFSLTKEEINGGAYIETLTEGSFELSAKQRCPYAVKKRDET
ncbi:MAG TPA: hypothetical protein CFH81_08720 [Sulfurovum sp. UBA12169]|nr:MAG TPA: hypothetical protein CFH81_08720 [Sulfurovum sp. UBA12169]